ncbi:MAG: hypothetical protein RLY93_16935 [Sumerlaeia bacterium]
MKVIVSVHGADRKVRHQLKFQLEEGAEQLRKKIGNKAPADQLTLRSHLSPVNHHYHLTLSLHLPDHPLVVQRDGADIEELVRDSLNALSRELSRSLARIRKDHLRKRRSGHRSAFEQFGAEMTGLSPAQPLTPETVPADRMFARLRPLLDPMYAHSARIIESAQLAGELPGDYLEPTDLVDQVVVDVINRSAPGSLPSDPERLEAYLFRELDALLAREVESQQGPDARGSISLEASVPREQRQWDSTPEREEGEYFMPFEALRMEDILIDEHAEDPELKLTHLDDHREILRTLSVHSPKARSAFFLNRVEGFEAHEIANIQDRSETEVLNDIQLCVDTLRGTR